MTRQYKKLRVGVLFGGKSAEHEVSVASARNVLSALDKSKFEPVLIGIDKQGAWRLSRKPKLLAAESPPQPTDHTSSVTLALNGTGGQLVNRHQQIIDTVDVVFPMLHGPLGEDGTVQGLLELAGVPYVGAGVLGSAIGMDKDVMKRLLRDAGVAVTDFMVVRTQDRASLDPVKVITKLGLPVFVKPANLGSSVGVSKASSAKELMAAVDLAFQFDRKILLERAVIGDEVECAVLGNAGPKVSLPGRIVSQADFYSYRAKYNDASATVLEIPAHLSAKLTAKVQTLALQVFQILEGEGLARVDMFVTKDGDVLVNEINTLPGFTKGSMYPLLWEASGLSYTNLVSELLMLAVERFEQRQKLLTVCAEVD